MTDWAAVASLLRLPMGWKIRAKERAGRWTLTAYGPQMKCQHVTMSVSNMSSEATATAALAYRFMLHRDYGI